MLLLTEAESWLKTFLYFVFAIRYETALVEKVFDVPVVGVTVIKANSLPIVFLFEYRFPKVRDKCS